MEEVSAFRETQSPMLGVRVLRAQLLAVREPKPVEPFPRPKGKGSWSDKKKRPESRGGSPLAYRKKKTVICEHP